MRVALTAGTRLGPYEILDAIGAGGMGEVYRARDTRLGRDVAVKVLPAHLVDSPGANERFQREARAVGALQHPNICTAHDVGETSDGRTFLVMELLQGETLQQALVHGPLDATRVVDLGIAIAHALDAAHGAGLVHRDIKPANIFLTAHGPKVLDFGLAKSALPSVSAASMQQTLTVDPQFTQPGAIVGTVAYMAPEQLRGESVDARTDLFALGLVLYEMATGRPAFSGATTAVVGAAILNEEPVPPRTLRPGLPVRLEDVVLKAIDKDRGLRYQHAVDMRADLLRLKRDSGPSPASIDAQLAPQSRAAGIRLRLAAVTAGAIVVAVAAGIVYMRRAAPLTDKDTIVIADFANTTGDPVFDETLRRGLSVQLEQSPFLSLVSDQRIRKTLGLMGRTPNAGLTPDLAREVCERTGGTAVLDGSIAPLGSQYVLGLRARSCGTGSVLDEEQAQAARKEDVLNVLSQVAARFRSRVGESLVTVEKHSTPLDDATTSSLDALKAYSAGLKVNFQGEYETAIPLMKRAVELDPDFAIAHATLGLMYSNVGESLLAARHTSEAYRLRARASDPERFFIMATYDRQVTGNLQKAWQTLKLWTQTYPRDAGAHAMLGGFSSIGTGQYEQSIAAGNASIALDPDYMFAYLNVASANLYLDRFDECERAVQRALARNAEVPDLQLLQYLLAFLRGDRAGMDRVGEKARNKPGLDDLMMHVESLVQARSGRLESARQSSRRAIDLAQLTGQGERTAIYRVGAAIWESSMGDPAAARRMANDALALSNGRDVQYGAALALAEAGGISRAQALADDLAARFPEDTSVQYHYLPTLRALFALNAKQPEQAIEILQATGPYELAVPAISFFGFFGSLYPAYVRGLAYLATHEGSRAALEFQKIIDHRGLMLGDPVGALARLQLARALAMAGDAMKAKSAYRQVLDLWKDGDVGLAILGQTRAESDALR